MVLTAPPPPEPEPQADEYEMSNEPSFDDFSHLDELAAREQQAAAEAEANDTNRALSELLDGHGAHGRHLRELRL